jgi:hypothetical protein
MEAEGRKVDILGCDGVVECPRISRSLLACCGTIPFAEPVR